jgi:hypothetical protein
MIFIKKIQLVRGILLALAAAAFLLTGCGGESPTVNLGDIQGTGGVTWPPVPLQVIDVSTDISVSNRSVHFIFNASVRTSPPPPCGNTIDMTNIQVYYNPPSPQLVEGVDYTCIPGDPATSISIVFPLTFSLLAGNTVQVILTDGLRAEASCEQLSLPAPPMTYTWTVLP